MHQGYRFENAAEVRIGEQAQIVPGNLLTGAVLWSFGSAGAVSGLSSKIVDLLYEACESLDLPVQDLTWTQVYAPFRFHCESIRSSEYEPVLTVSPYSFADLYVSG